AYASKPIQSQLLFAQIESMVPRRPNSGVFLAPVLPKPSAIDFDRVLSELDGDREVLARILRLFLADYPGHMGRIAAAVERGDLPDVERAAHALRGGLGTLCAASAAAAAGRVETLAAQADRDAMTAAVSRL